MRKNLLLLLLLPSLLLAQKTKEEKEHIKNRDKYLFAARPQQKNFTHTIPFDYTRGQIVVPVRIDGETYNFLFDTGAATIVSDELKEKLDLSAVITHNVTDGAGRTEEEGIYPLPPVELSGVTFTDVVAVAADLAKFNTLFCIKVDGILGTNIMRTCHWKIDYTNKLLTFSSKKIKPGPNAVAVDFEENFSGSPLLRLFMGEYNFMAMVDTGYNGGFSLPDSLFFKSRKSREVLSKKGFGVQAMTLFTAAPEARYVAALDSVYIDNKRHLIKGGVGNIDSSPMILLGNEILSHYGEIVFDWKKRKMYLPAGDLNVSSVYDTYGFSPHFSEGKTEVVLIWEGTEAEKQGMEIGDTIVTMNGFSSSGITDEQWCSFVEIFTAKSEPSLSITVRKTDGREVSYTLPRVNLLQE